jgi:hypothetical protein
MMIGSAAAKIVWSAYAKAHPQGVRILAHAAGRDSGRTMIERS